MKKLLTTLMIIVAVLACGWAAAAELPEPQGYFNDFAGVATAQEADQLEAQLRRIPEDFGFEFAIAVIRSSGDLTPKQYAVELFEKWGIGAEDKDNGLLLLHSLDEREIWFEVGYGLEGVFTDVRTGAILDASLEYLKAGQYVKAYTAIIAEVRGVAAQSEELVPSSEPVERRRSYSAVIGAVVVGYLILLVGARLTGQWWLYHFLYRLLFIFFRGGRGGFGGFGGGGSGGGGSGREY